MSKNKDTLDELKQGLMIILADYSIDLANRKRYGDLLPAQRAVKRIEALIQEEVREARTFNRLEIIDHTDTGTGRDYVKWEKSNFEVTEDIQDGGRTLKIFLKALEDKPKGKD